MSFKIKPYAYGGKVRSYQTGGMVEGPSHEEGGVPTVDQTGAPIAEVEGGERIFSVEDTQQIEQMAAQIAEMQATDPASADRMATELGYMVVQMLFQQEQNTAMEQQDMMNQGMEMQEMGEGLPPYSEQIGI